MRFKPYAKYKHSGVEWLGDVPDGWDVRKLSQAFDIIGSGTTPKSDVDEYYNSADFAWVNTGDLNDGELYGCVRSVSQAAINDHSSLKIYPSGSVIIAMYGATIGKLGILRFPASVNQACCVFVGEKIIKNSFLFYWLFGFREQIVSLATGGGQPNISQETLRTLRLACPRLSEQTQIATFLDRETAKIDTLINKQEKLIELLKEKRQAVISHAVTKGLDSTVPMKDSGVEWLGEVPAHWQYIQLGRICRQISDGPHFSPNYVDDGVMFISARNIKVDRWELDDVKFVSAEDCIEFDRRVIPEIGDVLYTKGGTTGVARVVDLPQRFQVWVHVAVLKIYADLADPYFVAYALNSIGSYEQSQLYTRGATNQDLGLTRMVKIWITLPKLKEQAAIVSYLDIITEKIDALIAKAEQAIALQKEHRTALISAAVTGKIDVRNEVGVSLAV